ncbi:MAG: AAA family ATPase [Planctomycetes bacterium]|nr:AAA family ATPase [Planctomycetota bacterium]
MAEHRTEHAFGARLQRYLERERAAEMQSHLESRAQPLAQRVEDGDAIAPAKLESYDSARGVYALRVEDNLAKFRPGDPVWLSDGRDPESGLPLVFLDYQPREGRVLLQKDRFGESKAKVPSGTLVVDRRRLENYEKLHGALERAFRADDERGRKIGALLAGQLATALHPEALERASAYAAKLPLDATQRRAIAEALAAPDVYLIQGPPGTGKTIVLAHLVAALVARGRRVLVSAFTHTAIDNALLRIAEHVPVTSMAKLATREQSPEVASRGIKVDPSARKLQLPSKGGLVVGATAYGALKLEGVTSFDVVVLDEAGQVALPHAVAALLSASRWILVGDHQQLRPVTQGEHLEREVTRSIFEHLHAHGYPHAMLQQSYRMNAELVAFPSACFYAGQLASAASAASRRLETRPGGRYAEILTPERAALFVDLAHEGNPTRSFEEAELAGELAAELVLHHGVPASEIKLIAPFRAQNRALLTACARSFHRRGETLPRELEADTVDRIQGQESEVVILSLTASDEGWLERKVDFYFDAGRLNVAITRAKTKLIVLGSSALLRVRPRSLEDVVKTNPLRKLLRSLPRVPAPPIESEER